MKSGIWILTFFAILSAGLTLTVSSCKSKSSHEEHQAGSKKKTLYHCAMHPSYTSDKPGDCPICNMKLVPVESEDSQGAQTPTSPSDKKIKFYRHPMQPEVTSPVPAKDEMGMDYIPVYEGEEEAETAVPGQATVKITPERQQLIGVRVVPAMLQDLKVLIRASGRVAYDPDLYSTIVEYQEALKTKEKVKDSPLPDVHERAEALIRSSALRLRQMGLSQGQINKLSHKSANPTNLLLSEKGESVWVYAQIYEYESGLVKPGHVMEVASSAYIDRKIKGRVIAVDTIVDPQTRTLRVRGEVLNPEGLLKPEMYVDVTIHVDLGRKLAVPKEAVLDSGTRRMVFVEESPGRYEPREVKVGRKAEEHYEIRSGLKEGEKVVVSANFLIDSESRLKSAISQTGGSHSH